MKNKKLMQLACEKWGNESQRRMGIEECAELIQALCKYERNQHLDAALNIVEEMVDVELMLEQLKLMFPEYESNADRIRGYKLQRLSELLGVEFVR